MIYILSVLFIILNILDWYLTKRVIDKGGRELNPVLKVIGIWQAKLILVPVIIVLAFLSHWALLAFGCAAILFCVIWNWIQYRRS